MKLRKQYYNILAGGRYLIVINQLEADKEEYEVCVREYNGDDVLVNEYIRPKTSPFMDGIKKEMCFFVQAPIDDTIPVSEFEVNEFI